MVLHHQMGQTSSLSAGFGFGSGSTNSTISSNSASSVPSGRVSKRKHFNDHYSHDKNGDLSQDIDMFSASFDSQLRTRHNSSDYSSSPRSSITASRVHKRQRNFLRSHALPVPLVIESLDKKGMQTLIDQLCQRHPEIAQEVGALAPKVTVNSAVEMLRNRLEVICRTIPLSSDPRGDYAFLRVKPLIDEFLDALRDYTSYFLPNPLDPSSSAVSSFGQSTGTLSSTTSNTFAFLDKATELLTQLPEWDSPGNNHARSVAFDELCTAWIVAMREASRAHPYGIVHDGWPHKLNLHNERCGGLLSEAVEVAQSELSWISENTSPNYSVGMPMNPSTTSLGAC